MESSGEVPLKEISEALTTAGKLQVFEKIVVRCSEHRSIKADLQLISEVPD